MDKTRMSLTSKCTLKIYRYKQQLLFAVMPQKAISEGASFSKPQCASSCTRREVPLLTGGFCGCTAGALYTTGSSCTP